MFKATPLALSMMPRLPREELTLIMPTSSLLSSKECESWKKTT
jgi:hypothetical protein